uniref:Uncharacterized protein n=1 Tax=Guillardia theta TaxID=55529 RepID=A0A7S4KB09_GUITH|mmetsp:Transcript_2249/g.6837  ORF Transcript_2249/g.6837 Transcript_2249/m.6837 type:complete len:128 (+) Transcript_2249:51-434(+)
MADNGVKVVLLKTDGNAVETWADIEDTEWISKVLGGPVVLLAKYGAMRVDVWGLDHDKMDTSTLDPNNHELPPPDAGTVSDILGDIVLAREDAEDLHMEDWNAFVVDAAAFQAGVVDDEEGEEEEKR